jgi:aconitate hydratase
LGVRAVVAETYERIHRSNLVGMGIFPLQFQEGTDRHSLELDGSERYDIVGVQDGLEPGMNVELRILRTNGAQDTVPLTCRIDTMDEVEYYKHGGILHFVLRQLLAKPGDRNAA